MGSSTASKHHNEHDHHDGRHQRNERDSCNSAGDHAPRDHGGWLCWRSATGSTAGERFDVASHVSHQHVDGGELEMPGQGG